MRKWIALLLTVCGVGIAIWLAIAPRDVDEGVSGDGPPPDTLAAGRLTDLPTPDAGLPPQRLEVAAKVHLRLVDAVSGLGVAGARVTAGREAVTTDQAGRATLPFAAEVAFADRAYGEGTIGPLSPEAPEQVVRLRRLARVGIALAGDTDGAVLVLQSQEFPDHRVQQTTSWRPVCRGAGVQYAELPVGRWGVAEASGKLLAPRQIVVGEREIWILEIGRLGGDAVAGLVVDTAGHGIAECRVSAASGSQRTNTDANGRFALARLDDPVLLDVGADGPGFEPRLALGPFRAGDHAIVIVLQRTRRHVAHVTRDGVPMADPVVTVLPAASPVAVHGEHGAVVLPGPVPPGAVFEVGGQGLAAPVLCAEWAVRETAEQCDYDVAVRTRRITVAVRDPAGRPVPGAVVAVWQSPAGHIAVPRRDGDAGGWQVKVTGAAERARATVDGGGLAVFDGLVGAALFVRVVANGCAPEVVEVPATVGDVTVTLVPVRSLHGRVRRDAATAAWPCFVSLQCLADGSVRGVPVEDGEFTVAEVKLGEHRASLRLGPTRAQLSGVDLGVVAVGATGDLDLDGRGAPFVELAVRPGASGDLRLRSGDRVYVRGVNPAGALLPVEWPRGEAVPRSIWLVAGDYLLLGITTGPDGKQVTTARPVTLAGGSGRVEFELAFAGEPMQVTVRDAKGPRAGAWLRLAGGNSVGCDANGECELAAALPEGTLIDVVEFLGNGQWRTIATVPLAVHRDVGGQLVGELRLP